MAEDKITDTSKRPVEVAKSALAVNTVAATEGQKLQAEQEIVKDPTVSSHDDQTPERKGRRSKAEIAAEEATANGGITKDTDRNALHASTLQSLSDERRALQVKAAQG
jgi:hypothetical protein